MIFQSTRPSRASTLFRKQVCKRPGISIHKALAGLDLPRPSWTGLPGNFNPQGPRGPRRVRIHMLIVSHTFQSTRPSRASTNHTSIAVINIRISIHKALAGLDVYDVIIRLEPKNFNPQGPRGPRLSEIRPGMLVDVISIHKALAGLDSKTIQQSLHIPLTFYALCPPLLISTSSIHSPSLFSRLFLCFSGANLPDISC